MTATLYVEHLYESTSVTEITETVWRRFRDENERRFRVPPDTELPPDGEFSISIEYDSSVFMVYFRPFHSGREASTDRAPDLIRLETVVTTDIVRTLDQPTRETEVRLLVDIVHHVYRSTRGDISYVYGLDPGHAEAIGSFFGIPVDSAGLSSGRINDASWLMVFPPDIVESYGLQFLLEIPAWRIDELDDGSVLEIGWQDPTDGEAFKEKSLISAIISASTRRSPELLP